MHFAYSSLTNRAPKSGRTAAVVGGIALAFLGFGSSAQANYVTNGNFTSTTSGYTATGSTGNGLIYNSSLGNSNSTAYASYLTGWNVITTNASADIAILYTGSYGTTVNDQYSGGFALANASAITAPPLGGNFIADDASNTNTVLLTQTLTNLSANTVYTLTYYQATDTQSGFNVPNGSTEDWSVSFGNATDGFGGYTSTSPVTSQTFGGWVQESVNFTTGAHASSETLQFYAQGPASGPPMLFLADVNLSSPSATPEPSTFVLGALALVIGLVYRAKRKTATVA